MGISEVVTTEIILIGPGCSGKSTLGWLLSEALGLPQIPLDSIKYELFKEIGYDEVYANELYKTKGFPKLHKYWRPYDVHSVKRVLENRNCVIDFGAGCTVYDDAAQFEEVRCALEPFKNVILLQPCEDKQRSLEILHEREGFTENDGFDFARYFLESHCNYTLAKHIVYNEGRMPHETCAEIISLLGLDGLRVTDELIGEKVSLRRADFTSWSAARELRQAADSTQWDPNAPQRTAEEERSAYIKDVDGGKVLIYGIHSPGGKLIGYINAFGRLPEGKKKPEMFELQYPGGTCETGIHIFDKSERGKGYAEDAYKTFLSHLHGRYALADTTACIYAGNTPSLGLFTKLGYKQTGTYLDNGSEYINMKYTFANDITLRRAGEDDIPAITRLYNDTVRNVNARDYTPQQIDVWASSAQNTSRWQAAVKEQYFILAEISGKLAGFSSITPDGYLDFMYVSKDFQRCGVASALLNEIERKAREQNNSLIYAHVSATARGFFEKNGYTVREVVEDHFRGVVFMNNVMEKRI